MYILYILFSCVYIISCQECNKLSESKCVSFQHCKFNIGSLPLHELCPAEVLSTCMLLLHLPLFPSCITGSIWDRYILALKLH